MSAKPSDRCDRMAALLVGEGTIRPLEIVEAGARMGLTPAQARASFHQIRKKLGPQAI